MGRYPKGKELLEQARCALSKAKTVDEFRQLQAVVFSIGNGDFS
ncbi:hypothetical protein [Desulfovibrio inopinatus]|nr:hypothetical protein [Desulfovibrio inopinatus]